MLSRSLTYATEGLRYAMVPPIHGFTLTTLGLQWVFLGLVGPIIGFTLLGPEPRYQLKPHWLPHVLGYGMLTVRSR